MPKTLMIATIFGLGLLMPGIKPPLPNGCWSVDASASFTVAEGTRPTDRVPDHAFLLLEEALLQKRMNIGSKVLLLEERTAFADPKTGNIYFGVPYFEYVRRKSKDMIEPKAIAQAMLRFILAHEFAHQFQFKIYQHRKVPLQPPTPLSELQADVIAGYYLGLGAYGQPDALVIVQDLAYAASQLGDPYFNDSNHHGQPLTRAKCISEGVQRGMAFQFQPIGKDREQSENTVFEWSLIVARQYLDEQSKHRNFQFEQVSENPALN